MVQYIFQFTPILTLMHSTNKSPGHSLAQCFFCTAAAAAASATSASAIAVPCAIRNCAAKYVSIITSLAKGKEPENWNLFTAMMVSEARNETAPTAASVSPLDEVFAAAAVAL